MREAMDMVTGNERARDGFITEDKVGAWLRSLEGQGMEVMAPVERDGKVAYERLSEAWGTDAVLLDFKNSHVPPKGIVFPQTEVMMTYRTGKDGTEVRETRPAMRETVVFGIRPCDARAVHIMDAVFSGFNPDPYYWERRNRVVLVGLGCTDPHYTCFCTTVGGSPHGTEGLDMLLTRVDGGLHALALTEKGEEVMSADHFREPTPAQRDAAKTAHEAAEAAMVRPAEEGTIDPNEMAEHLSGLFDHPFWDETARKCLGCGACTFICPTCHCFDINDEGTKEEGRRVRTWDSCQFPEFTLHTSSHNPRPVKRNRIRQRVLHKFKYMPENMGEIGCVGCGRCIQVCPVNMDIFRIIFDVKEVEP